MGPGRGPCWIGAFRHPLVRTHVPRRWASAPCLMSVPICHGCSHSVRVDILRSLSAAHRRYRYKFIANCQPDRILKRHANDPTRVLFSGEGADSGGGSFMLGDMWGSGPCCNFSRSPLRFCCLTVLPIHSVWKVSLCDRGLTSPLVIQEVSAHPAHPAFKKCAGQHAQTTLGPDI